MKHIDVLQLAEEIGEISSLENNSEFEVFLESISGQSFNSGELVTKVIAPLIGITGRANRRFTIELVQRVVNELEDDS